MSLKANADMESVSLFEWQKEKATNQCLLTKVRRVLFVPLEENCLVVCWVAIQNLLNYLRVLIEKLVVHVVHILHKSKH